jgi:hypothetical protein
MLEIPDPDRTTAQGLFEELKVRAREEGIRSYEEYTDLVDELVNEKLGYGFFATGDDLVQIRRDLEMMWPQLEEKLRRKKEEG